VGATGKRIVSFHLASSGIFQVRDRGAVATRKFCGGICAQDFAHDPSMIRVKSSETFSFVFCFFHCSASQRASLVLPTYLRAPVGSLHRSTSKWSFLRQPDRFKLPLVPAVRWQHDLGTNLCRLYDRVERRYGQSNAHHHCFMVTWPAAANDKAREQIWRSSANRICLPGPTIIGSVQGTTQAHFRDQACTE
jgi:hypothetical protein